MDNDSGAMLLIGDRIGQYRIVSHLAGNTYRAVHVSAPRRALLEIAPATNWRETSIYMMRAQRLVESLQHPGIARIVERGMLADCRPWTATEVPSGFGLDELVARRSLPATELAALIRDIADVLAYAHSLGVAHRALTLRSIVLATGARAYPLVIADWGTRIEDLGVYAAPELSMSASYDGRADIYALGVIAFRVATRRFPGEAGVYDVTGVPPALGTLIGRMLAIDPNERPTAAEVRGLADELTTGEDIVRLAGPRRPRWTPAPQQVVVSSENASTATGEIFRKH